MGPHMMHCTVPQDGTSDGRSDLWLILVPCIPELREDRSDVVADLFCGAGFFGLALAASAHSVYGYERSAAAISGAHFLRILLPPGPFSGFHLQTVWSGPKVVKEPSIVLGNPFPDVSSVSAAGRCLRLPLAV